MICYKGGITGKYFKVSMCTTVIKFKQHVTLRLDLNTVTVQHHSVLVTRLCLSTCNVVGDWGKNGIDGNSTRIH